MIVGTCSSPSVLCSRAHSEIEELVTQLESEKEALNQAQQQSTDKASDVEAILEAIVDGIYVYDAQDHVLRTNAAAQTLNPLTRQRDYLNRSFPERFTSFLPRDEHGQPFEPSNLPVSRVLRGETLTGTHTVDTILRQLDGTDILLNVSGAPVRDDGGQIRGAVVVTRDMTERQHLEQRRREALNALLAMTQLIGQEFKNTNGTDDENREQTVLNAQEVAQRIAELICSFLGCQRLSISIVEPETEILRPFAVVGLSPDQEQQWWKEQEHQQSRLVDSPDQTLVQHLQANEVALFDMTQPPWNSYLQLMLERAERQTNVQNRMVSDLLDISRLQADKLELRLIPCDLATVVHEMVEDQRSTTPKRTLSLEMAEGVTAPVIADPERIGQVLNNYLSNALKYSPVDRPVEVQLKKEGNMVRILVRDEGPGLNPLEQEQVWERFYQVEGIKRQRGASMGLGLGLHICREIVEQHQGEVGVESTKGEGSTFWFTLPLIEHDDQETA